MGDLFSDEQLAAQEAANGKVLDIETVKRQPLPVQSPAQMATRQIQMVQDLRKVVIAQTRPNHWVQWSEDKVVPDGSECLRLRTMLGIRFVITDGPTRSDHKDEDGQYYEAVCHGEASFVNSEHEPVFTVPAFGVASSRHPFFAKKDGKWRPPRDVNSANILRMSWTECLKDGVRGLLALVIDADELEGITGKRAGQDAGKHRQPKNHSQGDDEDVAKQRAAIKQRILELTGGVQSAAKAFLMDLTTFTDKETGKVVKGVALTEELSEKRVAWLYRDRDKVLTMDRYNDFVQRKAASNA